MSISASVRETLLKNFRAELQEHIQTITDGLLAVEQKEVPEEERAELLESTFRAAHSLKGAARAVGVTTVEQLAHALEDVMDGLRRGTIEEQADLFTACYAGLDAIQAVQASYEAGEDTPPLEALQALGRLAEWGKKENTALSAKQDTGEAQPEPKVEPRNPAAVENKEPPAAEQPAAPEPEPEPERSAVIDRATSGDETIRVNVSKLDALMAQLSELLVTKIRAEQRLTQIRDVQEVMTDWQKEWFSARSAYSRWQRELEQTMRDSDNGHAARRQDAEEVLDFVGYSQARLQEVNGLINTLTRQYADDTMHMALAIDALEEEIKRTRMLPLSTITGPFSRMVRDLAQEAGKDAILRIEGGDTELDKHVLEQIKDPLVHLLRNAVDHGLEDSEQRAAAGKPRRGTITLTAEQVGKDVLIAVTDDGAGLNLEAIRDAAVRRGRAAQNMSETELKELIFSPGISTSAIITDISGRGVGLDVVRRNVEALHGRIDLNSTPGKGTTFALTLPLALTSSRGLMVQVANEQYAVPLSAVERILQVQPEQITTLEGRDTVRYNGRPLTLFRLSDVLELPRRQVQRGDGRIPVLVLASAERRMGFVVDELVEEQEVVVKGLGKQLSRVGGITGATVMGSGEVVLILNVADLIKMAVRGGRRSVLTAQAEQPSARSMGKRQRVLVVDDSITTRTLEKNILEAAGYAVDLATDGQEAWEALMAGEVPDLIVSDIAMPRIGGFELTRRIKNETRTEEVPVILVTSLDSAEDKAQGIEVGADAYIVKGQFDQTNLLETIDQLV